MSVAVSGNTIRRIVVAHRTATVERRTGSAAVRAVIHCRTASERRNETLVDREEISGATIALAIAVELAIEEELVIAVELAIAAIAVGLGIVVALETAVELAIAAIAVVLVIAAA